MLEINPPNCSQPCVAPLIPRNAMGSCDVGYPMFLARTRERMLEIHRQFVKSPIMDQHRETFRLLLPDDPRYPSLLRLPPEDLAQKVDMSNPFIDLIVRRGLPLARVARVLHLRLWEVQEMLAYGFALSAREQIEIAARLEQYADRRDAALAKSGRATARTTGDSASDDIAFALDAAQNAATRKSAAM